MSKAQSQPIQRTATGPIGVPSGNPPQLVIRKAPPNPGTQNPHFHGSGFPPGTFTNPKTPQQPPAGAPRSPKPLTLSDEVIGNAVPLGTFLYNTAPQPPREQIPVELAPQFHTAPPQPAQPRNDHNPFQGIKLEYERPTPTTAPPALPKEQPKMDKAFLMTRNAAYATTDGTSCLRLVLTLPYRSTSS